MRWILGLGVAAALLWVLFENTWERLLFAPAEPFTRHEPDARYDTLFPYYVELCATTQFRSDTKGTGGTPGHAVMYLKGACRDKDAPYPKLRRCASGGGSAGEPEHGAGVSVNRWFRNVNWVAFDGRAQFYGDEGGRAETVTEARIEAAARQAIADGVYRGVELWPYPGEPPQPDLFDFVVRHSAVTDFALLYGRSALCGRVPVRAEMLDEVIDFLNDLNREFATGAADYRWSGYHDNCVHALANALAAASMREPIGVWHTRLRQVFHMAVPANEAIGLAELGTNGPVDQYSKIFDDDAMRNGLLEFGWLPTRQGAMLVSLPVHPENQIFDTQPRLLVFQGAVTARTTRRLLKLLDDPRATELDANLRHFRELYGGILADRERQEAKAELRGDRYRRARRRYYSVIEAELREVERMQAELARPAAAPALEPVVPGALVH
jgi:hypothetical protein